MTKQKKKEKKVRAWAVLDAKNCGIEHVPTPRFFWGRDGKYHIFKSREKAEAFIDEQFFDARDMGWRPRPCVITISL